MSTLPLQATEKRPGTKEAGDTGREALAAKLLEVLPYDVRAQIVAEIAEGKAEENAFGSAQRLAAVRYANEVNGIVTAAAEKSAEASRELPQIVIQPPPQAEVSTDAQARLLATLAHGGGPYDAPYPGRLAELPKPAVQPMRGLVRVQVRVQPNGNGNS